MGKGTNEHADRPAAAGGTPVRTPERALHYSRQDINEKDIAAVTEVLRSDFLTTGPKIRELEDRLCQVSGAKYAVACANGTAALHIACMAAGLKSGDEGITTPITFAASANCLRFVGARPVFADIDDRTWNIDVDAIEQNLRSSTRAVIPVDFTGTTADLTAIRQLADRHGLMMIEDGAHSIGTTVDGRPVGSIADMTTFSFHAVKTITGGEGGAVVTNDEALYRKLLLYRTHGITRDPSLMKGEPDGPWYYEMLELSTNYRLTDIQAALILSQLDRLEEFKARKLAIVRRYDEAFAGIPQLTLQKVRDGVSETRHLYILRLDPEKLTIGRREFFDAMTVENIHCNVHYIPVYCMPYYQALGYERGLCPRAEKLYDEMITIPLYAGMTDGDVEDVIRAVTRICRYYAA